MSQVVPNFTFGQMAVIMISICWPSVIPDFPRIPM